MKVISEIYSRNKLLAITGSCFLTLAVLLIIYAFFNEVRVLGVNSMIKPIKFSLSIWIYAWTLAYLLYYVNDQKRVRSFSILALLVMVYEESVIMVQAFRGKLSHFNQTEIVGGILYALMGIMIVWLTFSTMFLTIRFIRQKTYNTSDSFALSIKIGLILFVIFSFFGGYMSAINSHNVGGEIGGEGLPLLNWSLFFGDLRIAHFFGIHSLQIIPLFGYYISKNTLSDTTAKRFIWVFSLIYFSFVLFTAFQAIMGIPFVKL